MGSKGKYRKLTHVVYQCNYHIVWVPKYRFRVLTGAVGEFVEEGVRLLCAWKDVDSGIERATGPCSPGVFNSVESVRFGVHGTSEGNAGDQAVQELSEVTAVPLSILSPTVSVTAA